MTTYYHEDNSMNNRCFKGGLNRDVQRMIAVKEYWINEGYTKADFRSKSTWAAALLRGPVYHNVQVGDASWSFEKPTFGVTDMFCDESINEDKPIKRPRMGMKLTALREAQKEVPPPLINIDIDVDMSIEGDLDIDVEIVLPTDLAWDDITLGGLSDTPLIEGWCDDDLLADFADLLDVPVEDNVTVLLDMDEEGLNGINLGSFVAEIGSDVVYLD